MRPKWSDPAVANLQAIHDYISRDAPGRADRFVQRLIAAAEPLRDLPRMGRVTPEGDGRQREIFFDPYRSAREMPLSHLRTTHPDWSEERVRGEAARRLSLGTV